MNSFDGYDGTRVAWSVDRTIICSLSNVLTLAFSFTINIPHNYCQIICKVCQMIMSVGFSNLRNLIECSFRIRQINVEYRWTLDVYWSWCDDEWRCVDRLFASMNMFDYFILLFISKHLTNTNLARSFELNVRSWIQGRIFGRRIHADCCCIVEDMTTFT